MEHKYIMNYFDFMLCVYSFGSLWFLCAVSGFPRKRNDSADLAGRQRRQVVSAMKADAMFPRSGDHQELVFPVEGKNWFFDNTCDMWQLYRFLLKSANRREIGKKLYDASEVRVISSTMHCQCLPRVKRQKSSAPSGTQWNLFALLSWKDATIYLEILLIIISNIWRMCSHGETFCFLQKIQENTEHSSDEKSFRAHIG